MRMCRRQKKHEYAADDVIMDKIRVLEKKMDGRGRVLIRPSGTGAFGESDD